MATLLRMPEVAAGTTEAVLSEWTVAENATITAREVIATVETEKAVVDVEAETDGVVLQLLVAPGAEVEIGAPIALVAVGGEKVDDIDAVLRSLGVAAEPMALEVPEAATTPEPSPAQVGVPAPVAPSALSVPSASSASSASSAGADTAAPGSNGSGARVFASPLARRLAKEAGLEVSQLRGTGPARPDRPA